MTNEKEIELFYQFFVTVKCFIGSEYNNLNPNAFFLSSDLTYLKSKVNNREVYHKRIHSLWAQIKS